MPVPAPVSIALSATASRVRWIAGGAAAALIAYVALAPLLTQPLVPRPVLGSEQAAAPEHTISVAGTGRITLSPDVADVRLGVTVTKATIKEARATAAALMQGVLAALKKAGVAERDITTSTLSLQPTYDYNSNGNPPRLTGYQFTNAVSATVRSLDALGDAIDSAIAAGATSLDGVTFRVDDETKAEAQARSAAMADAKAKADTLASAGGVSIVGISSISEIVAPIPYPIPYGAAAGAADKAVPTPIQPGTTEVDVTVNVLYRIG